MSIFSGHVEHRALPDGRQYRVHWRAGEDEALVAAEGRRTHTIQRVGIVLNAIDHTGEEIMAERGLCALGGVVGCGCLELVDLWQSLVFYRRQVPPSSAWYCEPKYPLCLIRWIEDCRKRRLL